MYLSKIQKSKFFQVVLFLDGKRTTISTKTTNYKEAQKFLYDFQSGRIQKQSNKRREILLSEYKDEYINYLSPSMSKKYIQSINLSFKMLINYLGDIDLSQVSVRQLDKFITETFSRTQRGATLYYRTLKAAFSKALLWDYIQDNPIKKIKSPKVAKSLPLFISHTEFQKIMNETNNDNLKNIFFVAFYTGMRLGEILNMKWSWIDLNNQMITTKCSSQYLTKSKKERQIPLNQTLVNLFSKIFPKVMSINNDQYVFTKTIGVKLNEDYISKKFKKAVKSATLNPKIHFHTLRHSFASLLVQKGESLYVIKELLGHESISTTEIYSHLQKQNLRDAVNKL